MQVDLLPEDLDIEGLTDELPTGLMGLADCVAAPLVLLLSLEARSRHNSAIVQQQAWPCAGMWVICQRCQVRHRSRYCKFTASCWRP